MGGQPSSADPWDRDVDFEPTMLPYDPRDFLRGVIDHEGRRLRGFFDAGSWIEYLEGWGRTVITGRARLGGIPMGVIAVETRSVDRLVPADPSNSESCEVKESMGGKVWFPDSAFKTAQALKDFNRGENLPAPLPTFYPMTKGLECDEIRLFGRRSQGFHVVWGFKATSFDNSSAVRTTKTNGCGR